MISNEQQRFKKSSDFLTKTVFNKKFIETLQWNAVSSSCKPLHMLKVCHPSLWNMFTWECYYLRTVGRKVIELHDKTCLPNVQHQDQIVFHHFENSQKSIDNMFRFSNSCQNSSGCLWWIRNFSESAQEGQIWGTFESPHLNSGVTQLKCKTVGCTWCHKNN